MSRDVELEKVDGLVRSNIVRTNSQQEVENRGAICQGGLKMAGRQEFVQEMLRDSPLPHLDVQVVKTQSRQAGRTSVDDRPVEQAGSLH